MLLPQAKRRVITVVFARYIQPAAVNTNLFGTIAVLHHAVVSDFLDYLENILLKNRSSKKLYMSVGDQEGTTATIAADQTPKYDSVKRNFMSRKFQQVISSLHWSGKS